MQLKVCVIGAGAAGLPAARHAKDAGFDCVVYEMASELGGVWVYTDDTSTDKYGYPVHSAMYRGLVTNLPKEIMGYPDFSIQEHPQSYLKQEDILQFLNSYADHFDIPSLIKFNHIVTEIFPLEGGKWRMTVEEKSSRKVVVEIFDVVMICTGHYSSPNFPRLPGMDVFQGKQYHSKYYRHPEPFTGQNVLVIGAGPSGMDLALHLSKTANKVFFSHNNKALKTIYPDNVIMKPNTRLITRNGAEFEDGSSSEVDVIFYCTGYVYDFPFLHESCGIHVTDNFIRPLYKHIVHMERPSMCFIGIPFNVCAFHMFDLQARFYVNYLSGSMKLPTLAEMRRITEEELLEKLANGLPLDQAHMLGSYQRCYYSDLAKLAGTRDIPEVMLRIKQTSGDRFAEDLLNFRRDVYKIVDDYNFTSINYTS